MKFTKPLFAFLLLSAIFCIPSFSSLAHAEGWGSLKGQITFDGEIKVAAPVVAAGAKVPNAEICAVKDIPSEELLIDPKSKGIKNCVIWVSSIKEIHPDLKKPAKAEVVIDNVDCVFTPHIAVVQTSQGLKAVNADGCSHNVKSNFLNNKNENPILSPKDRKGFTFKLKNSEMLPMPIECNIHAWMRGYCMVLEHPYFAVTDKDGNFEIKNLPEGRHNLIIWQEKAGFLNRRVKVKIVDGKTVVSDHVFKAKKFKN